LREGGNEGRREGVNSLLRTDPCTLLLISSFPHSLIPAKSMFPNPLKSKLQRGENTFGLFAFEFFTPGLAQSAKGAGAEFILFDMEHSVAGIDAMTQEIACSRGLDITPLVRVPSNQYLFVARALDAGAHGIMVPMVE